MSLVKKLMKTTGADQTTAQYLLEACGDNYDMAVSMYADSQPAVAAVAGAASNTDAQMAAALAQEQEEDEVRAPIPRKFEVLCPVEEMTAHPSNIAFFRDFENETRAQEALMGLDSGLFKRPGRSRPFSSPVAGSSRAANDDEASAKMKKLEDLFKPPLDLIYKGSFFMAREEGQRCGRWLLVNVQNDKDFACHRLNRDVWSNANVRYLMEDTFLLWQAAHDSEHGRKYSNFYPINSYPYISIIDSRTGEHMNTFSNTDPKEFCLFLKDFIKQQGRMQTSLNSDSQNDSTNTHKRKHNSASPPNIEESSTKKTLVDINEEDQLKLAIAESLKNAQSGDVDSDDDSVIDIPLETFSDDEDNQINYSFDDKSSPNKAAGTNSSKSINGKSNINGSGSFKSEWLAAKGNLTSNKTNTSDATSTSLRTSDSVSKKDDADEHKTDRRVDELDKDSWRVYTFGCDDSNSCTLALRLPDGSKDSVTIPRDAPLQAVFEYLRSRGYSPPDYRAFSGWPKKDLFDTSENISLKDAGLHIRDTIILQQD